MSKRRAKVLAMRHPAVLRIEENERLNLLRLQAEVRAASAEAVTKQREASDFIKSIDPDGKYHKLVGDAMTAQGAVQQTVAENNAAIDAISKRLRIDLRRFSIGDDSVLHELEATKKQS